MKKIKILFWIFVALLLMGCNNRSESQTRGENLQIDTANILTGLHVPWEILWGPDDHIWLTERSGIVSRVNPDNRQKITLLNIDVTEQGESGLLGMALHPQFPEIPFVYLVYNYSESNTIKERLVRYTYASDQLSNEEILINDIQGNTYHVGSRLRFGPDGKLYMTTGDAGETSLSQNLNSLNGKLLRINDDGSIPDDNPISGSYVFAWGLRNSQGLDFADNGMIYSSEHGPNSDDEMNILEEGRNFGWPDVNGPCNTPAEIEFCNENNVREPIQDWTPTLAVAGNAYYNHNTFPEWTHSIILTSLKAGKLLVLHLNEAGDSVTNTTTVYDNELGRLRDVCVSDNGRVFISTSNRDGRGTPKPGDDKIIELKPANVNSTDKDDKTSGFRVYPNPAQDIIKAELDQKYLNGTFSLYDVKGNLKLEGSNNLLHGGIDISTLRKGIYSLVIKIKSDHIAASFVVL